jgi:peptidoglycan hydrolase-like protein with peptidoglycan-binding domain
MRNCIAFLTVTIGLSLAVAESVWADDNVREVQEKLHDDGFYSGELDGAYSSDLSAALSRYQIRNGLPITGQLDAETSKALGAKAAVGPASTAGTEQNTSETWRRLRKSERRTPTSGRRSESVATETRETSSPRNEEASGSGADTQPRSAPVATAGTAAETTELQSAPTGTERTLVETTESASAPPATTSADEFSNERLRDYVAAFVLAGLDRNVGAETEFFADRVEYYDSGPVNRDKIREDLKRYDERWPERHFWVAGTINVERQSDQRVQVTFPLGFKLRNGNKQSSGKVNKTLVLDRAGDDLQIVAVNERKSG